jgi:uncharacterized membrane protein
MNYLEKNKYRIILVATLLLCGVRIGLGGFFIDASDITAQSIAAGVNNERSERNLTTLNYNADLAEAAQYKASDMIARNYFSHTDPDGNYIWPTIVADGYTPYTTLGENLAVNFPDTDSLMSAWIDSPEHRANILNSAFQDQGAGTALGTGNGQYTDAMANTFGAQPPKTTPKASTPNPPATPAAPAKTPVTAATKTTTPPKTTPTPKTTIPTPPKTNTPPATPAAPAKTPTASPTTATPTTIPTDIAQATPATPTLPTVQQGLSRASIETDTMVVTPEVSNATLDLHVVFVVDGVAKSISGSVLGVNTEFTNNGNDTYSGDLSIDQFTDYDKQSMTITVLDTENHESDTIVPLRDFPIPASQNPTSVTSIANQIANPNLYDVYKYIIGIFAILFVALMLADMLLFRRTRQLTQTIKHWGDWNLPMIILIAGTALTVWWWH